jgi:hypothetical protein
MRGYIVALIAVTSVTLLTSCKPKISGQIVTNWVKPSEGLRVVKGQLSNAADSKLWDDVAILSAGRPHLRFDNPHHVIGHSVEVETVGAGKITCGVYETEYAPETYSGQFMLAGKTYIKSIVIYHYPNPKSLVTGQIISGQNVSCRCVRVKNYFSWGISREAYDCGGPSTDLVPVIKSAAVKVGGVQILLIDAKEADDFLKKKKTESEQQCTRIKADIEKMQSELNDDGGSIDSQSYTNDPRYIAAIDKSDNAIKTAQTLSDAIIYLRLKYGEPPVVFTRQYPQEQRDAWAAEKADMQRLRSIRHDADHIDDEIDSVVAKIKNEKNRQRQTATEKLNEANQALKSFLTPNFYLADFSPAALEMSLTDKKGYFVVRNPTKGTKIFAKVKSDEISEEFFWLVDLPQNGKKLILSDNNLFSVPANSP